MYIHQDPLSEEQELAEEEKPNNGGPPSPLMLQLMEIGFSRTSVEMAFKTLGKCNSFLRSTAESLSFQHILFVFNVGSERESSIEAVINWLLENPDMSGSEIMESDGREAAAVEGITNI